MSFGGLIALGVFWVILNLFIKTREKGARAETPDHRKGPGDSGGAGRQPPDATQQEGFSLERVLREMQRAKAEAQGRGGSLGREDVERVKGAWKKQRPAPAPARIESGAPGRQGRMARPSADEGIKLETGV
ncbi:MAG: hypothetical protein ACREMO_05155, partial [Gemmatimonadales bacterium]